MSPGPLGMNPYKCQRQAGQAREASINQEIWAIIEAGKDKEVDYTLEPPERKKKNTTLPTLFAPGIPVLNRSFTEP